MEEDNKKNIKKDNININEKEVKDKKDDNKENINDNDKNISDLIQKILNQFNIEKELEISYKKLISKNNLYFSLRYYSNTSLNPYDDDIFFAITLEDKTPYTILHVKCLSNFCFPSLFDNRDLCKTILNIKSKKEKKEKKEEKNVKIEDNENINKINENENNENNENIIISNNENIYSLENVINSIPCFIKEIKENEEMKHLLKFKEIQYPVDETYDINDFLINWNNIFFRVKQIVEDTEYDRYIIITDLYLLLIQPQEEFKNKGILLFFGYLHKLVKEETDNPNIVKLNWSKNHNKDNIQIILKVENQEAKLFDIIDKKVKLLIKKFKNVKCQNK